MAQDWASDVKRYAPDANDGVIAGIVRYCGIALQKVDSSLVSFSDSAELARVRNNFLKKKCGLTDPDETLDAAIAQVGERMKDDRTKNRVTVYYLLADRFGLHSLFVKAAKTTAAKAAPVAVGAAGALGALNGGGESDAAAAPPVAEDEQVSRAAVVEPVAPGAVAAGAAPTAAIAAVGTAGVAAALGLAPLRHPIGRTGVWALLADGGAGKSGRGFFWLALGLLALALIWILFVHKPVPYTPAPVVAAPASITVAETAIPEGAGIVTETRDEKPVVKVYFETGKADVAPAFAGEAVAFKTYLDANPGSSLGVSGYNDPTGNAAANATLSKKRAQAVKAALVAAAISDAAVELIKPKATTDTRTTNAEARRVEVYIK